MRRVVTGPGPTITIVGDLAAHARTIQRALGGVDTTAAVLIAPDVAESFAVDESTKVALAACAKTVQKMLEGVDTEAVDEFVDLMDDDPRFAKRFGHLPITTAPTVLRLVKREAAMQVLQGLPRRSSCGRPVRRARVRRHRARSRSPGRQDDDPDRVVRTAGAVA